MREFREQPSGVIVDLDDPETYKYLPDNEKDLDNMMFREIGKAICYMDYFHPDIFGKEKQEPDSSIKWTEEEKSKGIADQHANCGYYQRLRVYDLIKIFTEGRRHNYGNIMWFKEQVFRFQNETENMC